MKKLPITIKENNFNFDKLISLLPGAFKDAGFCSDFVIEILRKSEDEGYFVYNGDVNNGSMSFSEQFNFVRENSDKYVAVLNYSIDYSDIECGEFEEVLGEEFFETQYYEEDDEELVFKGCIELLTGEKFVGCSGDEIDLGEANSGNLGFVFEFNSNEITINKCRIGAFNIYQGGAVIINNAGQFDDKMNEFIETLYRF